MDDLDRLMAKYPQYKYQWVTDMPDKLSGLCYGDCIYINARKPHSVQYQTLNEEIGHQLTACGDIVTETDPLDRHEEVIGRRWSYENTISLDDLIQMWNDQILDEYEAADYFGVTPNFFETVINYYRNSRGEQFTYHGYRFNLSNGLIIKK